MAGDPGQALELLAQGRSLAEVMEALRARLEALGAGFRAALRVPSAGGDRWYGPPVPGELEGPAAEDGLAAWCGGMGLGGALRIPLSAGLGDLFLGFPSGLEPGLRAAAESLALLAAAVVAADQADGHRQRELLEDAEALAQMGSWSWDADTGRAQWSRGVYRIYGLDPEAGPPDPWRCLAAIPEEDRPAVESAVKGALDHRRAFEVEHRVRRPDGGERWVLGRGKVVEGPAGALRLVGSSQDITERKRLEQALEEREAFLRQVLDALTDLVLVKGADSRIVWANRAFRDFWGAEAAELSDSLAAPASPPRLLEDHLKEDAEVMSSGRPVAVPEDEATGRDGRLRRFDTVKVPVFDAQGRVALTVGVSRDVTERRDHERRLRESEMLLAWAEEMGHLGAWRWDFRSGEVRWSAELFRIFGRDPERHRPSFESYLEQVHPDDRERVQATVLAARAGGRDFEQEERILMADGSLRHLRSAGRIFRDEEGRPQHMVGTCLDVTELREALERSRRDAERLDLALKAAQVGLWDWDLATGAVTWTEGSEAVFGLAPGSFEGTAEAFLRRIDPEDRAGVEARIREVLEAGGDYRARYRIRLPDGALRWVEGRGRAFLDAEGRVFRMAGSVLDVTESMTAEARYQALVQNSLDLISVLDADGTMREQSPTLGRLLGWRPEELLGRSAFEYVHPEDLPRARELFTRVLEDPAHPSGLLEFRFLHKDGHWLEMEACVSNQLDHPAIRGVVSTSRDITERKRSERMLLQAQKLESLGILAGGVAHDFNNLLTALLGHLDLAKIEAEGETAAHLGDVEAVAMRAAALVRQMLAYGGRGQYVVQPVSLNALVQEITQLLAVSVSKKVRIDYQLKPGLPLIQGDPAQLQQVVMNLVTNASEAIGDREGRIAVRTYEAVLDRDRVQAEFRGQPLRPGRCACLEVEDTGCGMGPEVMARIFDPFFTTKATGRGLGLSAMLGILRGHGAGLHIDSEPGRGSRFKVCFRARDGEAAEPAPAAETQLRRFRGRVLLVDDEAEVRASTAALLGAMGLEVVEAADGHAALARLGEGRLDLALVDVGLPGLDGRELLTRIRALRPGLRVILSSGSGELPDGASPDGWLPKPYRRQELQEALAAVLSGGPAGGSAPAPGGSSPS